MTHLEIENLASDYLEGQLDSVRRAAVEQHLAGCAGCRELMVDVRRVFELCRQADALEPPPWLVPKILRATIGERKPSLAERAAAFGQPALGLTDHGVMNGAVELFKACRSHGIKPILGCEVYVVEDHARRAPGKLDRFHRAPGFEQFECVDHGRDVAALRLT